MVALLMVMVTANLRTPGGAEAVSTPVHPLCGKKYLDRAVACIAMLKQD